MRLGQNLFQQAGTVASPVALDSAADVLTWEVPFPVQIVRYGVWVTVLLDNTATPLILSLDTVESPVGSTRTERATLTEPAVDAAVGSIRVRDVPAFDMYSDNVSLGSNVVPAGSQVILEVKQGAVAGDGVVWVEYAPLQWGVMNHLPTGRVNIPVERTS